MVRAFIGEIPDKTGQLPHFGRPTHPFAGIVLIVLVADNGGAITPEDEISEPASKEVCRPSEWPILIVEAPIVQKFLRTVLDREGYQTIEVGSQSALELMEFSNPRVGLVITNAPGMFLPYAQQVALIYIAACPNLDLAARFKTCSVLQKPFHPAELLEAVRILSVRSGKTREQPAG